MIRKLLLSLFFIFPSYVQAEVVYKNLSATEANSINRLSLENYYLHTTINAIDGITELNVKINEAKKLGVAKELDIKEYKYQDNLHECLTVMMGELLWHFEREGNFLDQESSIINDGYIAHKKLKKINFDCSKHEGKVFDLFLKYSDKNYEMRIYHP